MRRKLAILALALAPALPASAYDYSTCRGRFVVWEPNSVTFEPSLASFPVGTPWNAAVEAMRNAWNTDTPGGVFQIQYNWVAGGAVNTGDGHNAILITQPAEWAWGANTLAVAVTLRSGCPFYSMSRIVEADVFFNPNFAWEHRINPQPPLPQGLFGPFNSILVGIHELGHAFGLGHENDVLATLNAFYPNGGVIGNGNEILPHADDTLGSRAGYGTLWQARDVAATAYTRTGAGTSAEIPAPAQVSRGQVIGIPYTVENRGTPNESWIDVSFFLSPDRNITTGDVFLGAAPMTLSGGLTLTPTATVTIPINAQVGPHFFGWVADPANAIPESDEGNNAVGLAAPINILANRAPAACFTTNPNSGYPPLHVFFDASCSSDLDGDPLTYTWDFGNGNVVTTTTPQIDTTYHDPTGGGLYTVRLTVEDPTGATGTAIDWVQVFCYETCW